MSRSPLVGLPLDAGRAVDWFVRPSDVSSIVRLGSAHGDRCIVYMRDGVQKVVALSVVDVEERLWPPRAMVPPPSAAPFVTCGQTWTVEGSRSTCFLTRGHEGTHRDPFTGASWGDGATP